MLANGKLTPADEAKAAVDLADGAFSDGESLAGHDGGENSDGGDLNHFE